MFVRQRIRETKKEGKVSYSYLVENRWNPVKKKYSQEIIYCLGRTGELFTTGAIEKMIVALDNFAKKKGYSALSEGVVLRNLKDEKVLSSAFDFGEYFLTQHIVSHLSLDLIIKNVFKAQNQKKINLEKLLTTTIALISHHLHPQILISERSSYRWYKDRLFVKDKITLTKDDFYRSLDFLIANKDEIEREYFLKNQNLFSQELDLVLFDTTSVFYYGQEHDYKKHKTADILQYGFSKDGKSDLKQIIAGVLMTGEGVPFAHEVFPGNTADLKSFVKIIKIVKSKYRIKRVILVADRGMVSELNLKILEDEGLEYIVGVKKRALSPLLKHLLLGRDIADMKKVYSNLYTFDLDLSSLDQTLINELARHLFKNPNTVYKNPKEAEDYLEGRRYIVCFNPQVSGWEKKKRQYFTSIVKNKIATTPSKDWFVKNGYKKYVKVDALNLSLNEKKLNEEELYDGVWIVVTNLKKPLSSSFISRSYKTLQFVERGFRDLKSQINLRPIFHFKEERIKAHVMVCFLTLMVKWYILKSINPDSDEDGLRFLENILNLKAIEVDKTLSLFVRTAIDEKTTEGLKKLKIRVPEKILSDRRKKPNIPPRGPGRPRKTIPQQPPLLLP